jgi:hypothetical protein
MGGTEMNKNKGGFRQEHKPSDSKKKKKNSNARVAGYIVGSMVLTAGAAVVIPKLMGKLSGKLYDAEIKKPVIDDDYEPMIVKREKTAEEHKEANPEEK